MNLAEAQENIRFKLWVGCFVFSIVCLSAHASASGAVGRPEQWVMGALSISLILSFAGTAAHLFLRDRFSGSLVEGGVASLLFIFWCAGLPAIMNPDNNIAVSTSVGLPDVLNANLYFFSWICFACVVSLVGHFLQDYFSKDIYSNTSAKTAKWYLLAATSVIVLASSIESHQLFACRSYGVLRGTSTCKRTSFAVALGVVTLLLSVIMVILSSRQMLMAAVEFGGAALMLILYTFGVALITFGAGPGSAVGNLYFAVWISFFVSALLSSQCFKDFQGEQSEAQNETAEEAP